MYQSTDDIAGTVSKKERKVKFNSLRPCEWSYKNHSRKSKQHIEGKRRGVHSDVDRAKSALVFDCEFLRCRICHPPNVPRIDFLACLV